MVSLLMPPILSVLNGYISLENNVNLSYKIGGYDRFDQAIGCVISFIFSYTTWCAQLAFFKVQYMLRFRQNRGIGKVC